MTPVPEDEAFMPLREFVGHGAHVCADSETRAGSSLECPRCTAAVEAGIEAARREAARELYEGPLEPGMVMVALGNDGEPFRRDLVLGRHPFKEGMVIYEALPCKMRKRLGSGVGEVGLCPELNMRLIMRPEESAQDRVGHSDHGEAPAPRDASARPDVLTATPDELGSRVHEAGELLLQSLRALALELPRPVWNHHREAVQRYLDSVGDAMESSS